MKQDVICINNTFSSDVLAIYAQYGVKIPEKDTVYTIRTKQVHSNGQCGITLNELNNPKVPGDNLLTSSFMVDVTFHVRRFTDLLGNPLKVKEEEIELVKQQEVKINTFYE